MAFRAAGSRPPPHRRGPSDLGLKILGLAGACVIGFLAGASTGLLAPPGLLGAAESGTEDATASVRVSTTGNGLSLAGLAGAAVRDQTILLMGTDIAYVGGRPDPAAPVRSDTMMVVGISARRSRLTLLSIPRDTRVEIPGHGPDKINAALALGGPGLAMQTVSNLLGIPIDGYALVKLGGLIRIVDLIGGVDIDVPQNMRYTDRTAGLKIRLRKGLQHLDGQRAHQFVRFRHDAQGDIGRIQRQQAFIRAVSQKLLTPQAVLALPQLVEAVQQNVETDIEPAQLMAIAAWAKALGPDQIRMAMLPGEFSAGMKASYWLVDEARSRRLAARLLQGENPSPIPDTPESRLDVHIAILNGTARPRLASEAARLLRSDGWTVWTIGDAERRDYVTTRILADSGDDAVAAAISRTLGLSAALEGLPPGGNPDIPQLGREDIDYVVILGQDFIHALRVPLPQLPGG